MQILNQAVITQQGLDLMAEASAGINQISFPKAVTTDDEQYTSMNINQLEALSDIDSVKQVVQPATPLNSYVYVDNDGQQQLSDEGTQKSTTAVTVPIVFPNKDVTEDYMIQAVGLYAHDENKNVDILYSIMTAATPRLQPAYNGTTPTSFKIKAITAIGRTSQLKTEVNDFDTVSEEEFHETLKGYATITYVDERLKNLKDVVYATKPEAPTLDVKANDSSVDYQISPALWYGRAEIEKFILYYKKHTDTDYSHIDVDIHQLSGNLSLQGGNQYDFYATAVNQSYESDGSTVQSYVLGKVPYNVKLSYTVDVPNKTINYTITADSNTNTPVTSYVLYFKDSQDSGWKSTTSGSLTGCTLGHSYNLKAVAVNAVGKSNETDVQTATIGNVLSAPQLSLSFNGSFNYQITPADDSDNPLKLNYYTVYYKRDSDIDWQSFRTTNLTGTVPNIQNGAKYVAKATATNSIGESTASPVTPAVITGTKPYDCYLTLTPDYTTQSVVWSATAQSDYGLPILSYTLYYRDTTSNGDWISTADHTLTGLTPNHDYELKANATNAVGTSDYSTNTAGQTMHMVDGRIFGAKWGRVADSTLTRTDTAVGLKAGINGQPNDFDSVGPWSQMKPVYDSYGNKFIRIPKLYIKKTQTGQPDNGLCTWQVSLYKPDDSWYLPKCFWDFKNNRELPYVDVGAYLANLNGNKLESKTGESPLNKVTIGQCRQYARNNGAGYQQLDIHVWDILQVLFIIEFATLDSQSVMYGNAANYNSGYTDGMAGSSAGDSNNIKYRGIESMYCNIYQFIDGVGINSGSIYVCDDADNYSDSQFSYPYKPVSYRLPQSSGYMQSVGLDLANPEVTLPTSTTSTQGYYNDYCRNDSGNNYEMYAGGDGSSSNFGLFYANVFNSFSITYSNVGGRLIKKAE